MRNDLESLVKKALAEDMGHCDPTTEATVPRGARCRVRLLAKTQGVLSGMRPFRAAFDALDAKVQDWKAEEDGARFSPDDVLAAFTAETRAVLTAERTAMNFAQHLSGVATLTAAYASALDGQNCRICDTRKTTPLLRRLEKEAVRHGGGANHRHDLSSGVLIKENHITAAGGLAEAVARARAYAPHLLRIAVEVRGLDEFDQALGAEADVIMLDNMGVDSMREAVQRARGANVLLEASGNVTLDRVEAIAECGVDFISVGAITHSAPAADFSLLIENA